jgi:cation diffusion facilitator family transporter
MLAVASAALIVNGLNAWLLHGVMGHGHAHDHGHGHAHDHGHGHGDHGHGHGDHGHGHGDHDHDHGEHEHGKRAHGHHLNLRGAWLHLLGDALGSLAAFIAGLAIRLGAPPTVDPVASFVVVAILVVGAIRLLRDAGLVLLDAAPRHLPVAKIEKVLLSVEGVTHVSALHVWSLGTGHDAITAHVRTSSMDPKLGDRAGEVLRKRFTAEYVAVHVEVD